MRNVEQVRLHHLIEKFSHEEDLFELINLAHLSHVESNSSANGLIYMKQWLEQAEKQGGMNG